MSVTDILKGKHEALHTLAPENTIREAVTDLANYNIGAIVISSDGETLLGILSERAIVRALESNGARALDQPISTFMTRDVKTCQPGDHVTTVRAIMDANNIRHLPVMSEGKLVGIVNIMDVIRHRLSEVQLESNAMMEYISGHTR